MADQLSDEPITGWVRSLGDGDPAAAQGLWNAYYSKLVRVATSAIRSKRHAGGISDGDDAAQSAFKSFCLGAMKGRYPDIRDRDSLWGLLLTITVRKVVDHRRYEHRARRGGGRILATHGSDDSESMTESMHSILSREPSPDFAAMVAEQHERLIGRLDDPLLRRIALMKMEGFTNEEIGLDVGLVRRTVIRKLQLVRRTWLEGGCDAD
jgi:DNA-directed RNA polymerase specialized sigma24 family protein